MDSNKMGTSQETQGSPRKVPWHLRRNYLANPKAQFQVILYFFVIIVVSTLGPFLYLISVLNEVNKQIQSLEAQYQGVMEHLLYLIRDSASTFFLLFFVTTTVCSFLGGILLSHRIFGSAYRVRVILSQLVEGKNPQPISCRKNDFLQDLFPFLKKLAEKVRP